MRHIMKIAIVLTVAFFTFLFILPNAAAGLYENENPANFAQWLATSVEDHVRATLGGPGRNVESVKVILPKRFTAPEDFDTFEIAIPNQNRLGSRIFVLVSFKKGSDVTSRINVMTVVKIMMDVVVANRELQRGAIISEEDIRIENRAAGAGYNNFITDKAAVIGKQATRKIRSGAPLLANLVSTPNLVRAGDVVRVVAQLKSLSITTLGKAKEDGNRGEWIKIINIESKKTINAKVIGPGKVMVEF